MHIDQNVSDKQHITACYSYWGDLNLPNDPFQNGVCQDRCTEVFNTNNFVLGHTYSFSPSTIMEVRLSYQRFKYDRTPSTLGYDLGQLCAGLATFLLGFPSSGNVGNVNLVAGQQLYPAVFANDDWHVTPKLTLNIGLRWEHSGPWTERFDRMSFFNPTQPNAVLAATRN